MFRAASQAVVRRHAGELRLSDIVVAANTGGRPALPGGVLADTRGETDRGDWMTHQEILEYLSYAAGHDLPVRITTQDGSEVVGVPTTVDSHPAANEVFLLPLGGGEGEIGIGLAQVVRVELV